MLKDLLILDEINEMCESDHVESIKTPNPKHFMYSFFSRESRELVL